MGFWKQFFGRSSIPVKLGMSPDEVKAKLGDPDRTSSVAGALSKLAGVCGSTDSLDMGSTAWLYERPEARYTIHFDDGVATEVKVWLKRQKKEIVLK